MTFTVGRGDICAAAADAAACAAACAACAAATASAMVEPLGRVGKFGRLGRLAVKFPGWKFPGKPTCSSLGNGKGDAAETAACTADALLFGVFPEFPQP